MILQELSARSKKRLRDADLLVSESAASTSLTLYSSRHHILSAQVRVGSVFVDMDKLKSELKISDKRWAQALENSQDRRTNSIILSVIDP